MINGKTIAVIVPAYNEEKQIGRVIETMPDFVDRIIIVNDRSTDATESIVRSYLLTVYNNTSLVLGKEKLELKPSLYNAADLILEELNRKEIYYFTPSEIINNRTTDERIILISNQKNTGVGGSIARGYKWCKDYNIDCAAVMAGDGQMDPDELKSLCMPIIYENVDYVKGNRLIHASANLLIPKTRYLGNSILSLLTKIASGYWRVSDTQTGYTAISIHALRSIKLHEIYKSYGMPNDMLVKLNIAYCSIREVPIKPVYKIGEQSKMKIYKVIPRISLLLFRSFFQTNLGKIFY